ncbi:MAG TPA: hypothetical protein VNY24_00520 [Candidatus Acidoferrales bacterium]|jgi:hypothetical protein|nr:hypothetical protein [Candidatus Acidoferrales bacterium]
MEKNKRQSKADPAVLEEILEQLGKWASAKSPVAIGFYGHFFVAFIEGQLHQSDRPDRFVFTAWQNRFRASVTLAQCKSVSYCQGDSRTICLEYDAERIMLMEPKADLSALEVPPGPAN